MPHLLVSHPTHFPVFICLRVSACAALDVARQWLLPRASLGLGPLLQPDDLDGVVLAAAHEHMDAAESLALDADSALATARAW